MKLLAWDTSAKAGAIVALEWAGEKPAWSEVRLAGEWCLNVESQHSERLLWGIHQVLESARWKLADIDIFGAGVGPGSFTGLRIGLTTARTLAHTLAKPLVGVSSLAALARPVSLGLGEKALVVAATDACKGELFALWGESRAVAECSAEGAPSTWKRGVREEVLAPESLVREMKLKLARNKMPWIAVGEGRRRYPETWEALPRKRELRVPAAFADQVQGRYLGMLAFEAYRAGLARPSLEVHPRYVRASDAELKLKAGLLKKAPLHAPTGR